MKKAKKFVVLAGDPINDDDAKFIKAIVVETTTPEKAYDFASYIAKKLGLDVCACHDGTPAYEVQGEFFSLR